MINSIDADGRITVTEGPQMLKGGTCGSYSVQFTFTLDHPTIPPHFKPPYGFIVQEVLIIRTIFFCNGIPKNISVELFYEMSPWSGSGFREVDTSSSPSYPNTYGSLMAIGTIKYFSKQTTGDLTKNPKWRSVPGRGPSVENTPKWWNYPSPNGESTGSRAAGSQWNCCCGASTSSQVAIP
jgi:hypothetical protein